MEITGTLNSSPNVKLRNSCKHLICIIESTVPAYLVKSKSSLFFVVLVAATAVDVGDTAMYLFVLFADVFVVAIIFVAAAAFALPFVSVVVVAAALVVFAALVDANVIFIVATVAAVTSCSLLLCCCCCCCYC